MAASVASHTFKSAAATTTVTTTTTLNVVAGSSIIICSNANNSNLNTPTDNVGSNTYNALGAEQVLTGTQHNRCWLATNVSGSATMTFTQTANDGGTPDAISIFVVVITGMAASPHDNTVVGADATSPFSSPAATPSQAGSLFIAFHSSESGGGTASYTPGAGFTTIDGETDQTNFFGGCTSYLHTSTTSSVTTSMTVSGVTETDSSNWLIIIKDPASVDHPITADSGSLGLTGIATILRVGATTFLRYRK